MDCVIEIKYRGQTYFFSKIRDKTRYILLYIRTKSTILPSNFIGELEQNGGPVKGHFQLSLFSFRLHVNVFRMRQTIYLFY